MAKAIIWTPEAEETFDAIINYLENNWTEREIEYFINTTNKVIELLAENPKIYRKTNRKNIHEALVTPHNLLIYKINTTHIDLLMFWDTRQNPRRRKL
jgi:plasmid stabilization system protein ParE